jgi:ABC-type branched-subunit amino acid transport system substrate-binding protein
MRSPSRYVAVLTFFAGMLVAGVIVPLATRSTDREVAAVGSSPTAATGSASGETPNVTTQGGSPIGNAPTAGGSGPATAGGSGLATAGGSGPASGATVTTRGATGSATSGVTRTASDVGVTADTIKVGVILLDLANASNFIGGLAGASADDQQAALQAFIDEANAAGGVNGRKLQPTYTKYDPVSGDANVNCNQLTEDDKVFAVLSAGIYGSPVLCVTQQHGTPLLNPGGYIDEYYARSNGLLFTFRPTKPRSSRGGAFSLESMGVLKDKTIGVFTSQAGDDDVAVDTGLVPALNELGHKVAHISRLSADNTSSSQIPVEVNQMRASGADLVFLETNVIYDTQFVQQADSQGYRPLYALSDSDDNVSDSFLSNMPSSFHAIGVTISRTGEQRVGAPETPTDADCRRVVETAAKKTLDRGSAGYEAAMNACNMIRLFVRGARAAGVGLTRASFSGGMQGIGSFPEAYTAGGSFRTGKFDAADLTRPLQADMGCKCWEPSGAFQPIHP